MKKNLFYFGTYQERKWAYFILHLFSIITLLFLLSIIYINENFHTGLFSLNQKKYEDSTRFVKDLEIDIKSIFDYERYKYLFEKDNKLDKNQKMFTIYESPGREKVYTLEDILNYSKNIGYYINEDYQVSKVYDGLPEKDATKYLVIWEKYHEASAIKEPGEAYKTLENLSNEVLSRLSKYYKAYKTIKLQPRNIYYNLEYADIKVKNTNKITSKNYKTYGKYIHISSDSMIADTNIVRIPQNIYSQANKGLSYFSFELENKENINYNIYIGIDTNYPKKDMYYINKKAYDHERTIYARAIMGIVLFLIVAFYSLFKLILLTGRESKKSKNIRLYTFDKHSIEFRACISLISIIIFYFISERVIYKFIYALLNKNLWPYAEKMLVYFIIYIICLIFLLSFVRSFKARNLWDSSFLKHLKEEGTIYTKSSSFTKIFASNYLIYYFINLFATVLISYLIRTENTLIDRLSAILLIFVLAVFNILVFKDILRRSMGMDKISNVIKNISDGNIKVELDLEEFHGKEKELASRIKDISCSFSNAVNEQVKSERLKADLITNVSHDIRTPLTSIINYINLLQRENIENEKLKSYIKVLEQKSLYLKNLIEDLIEASKVSSGNVKIELHELDFAELIKQVNGEFQEKYNTRDLKIIPNLPDTKVMIRADGRCLWRVLENLYNNNYKYAIENSRIYVDLCVKDRNAILSIKNISAKQLNISPDELTMRFVRGDVSRSTEGSGLGLSIAKSLTLMQGADFDIIIDGDLFKVILSFPIYDNIKVDETVEDIREIAEIEKIQ